MRKILFLLTTISLFSLLASTKHVYALPGVHCRDATIVNAPISVGQKPTISGRAMLINSPGRPYNGGIRLGVDLYQGNNRISTATQETTTDVEGRFSIEIDATIPLLAQPTEFKVRVKEMSTGVPFEGCTEVSTGTITPSCPHLGISVPSSGSINLGQQMNFIIVGGTKNSDRYKAELRMGSTALVNENQPANNGAIVNLTFNAPAIAGNATLKIWEGPNLCQQVDNYQIGITLPSATPVPISEVREIMCSQGQGRVGLSTPHPFPTGTNSVTFSYPNLLSGNYRMMVQDNFPSINWYEACGSNLPGPTPANSARPGTLTPTGNTFRYDCTFTDPEAYTHIRGFQLQKLENTNTWRDVQPYALCEWRPYDSPTCNLRLTHQDLPVSNPGYRDHAQLTLSGSGIPSNGSLVILRRISNNTTFDTFFLNGSRTIDRAVPNVPRGDSYKLEVYESILFGGGGARLINECTPPTYNVPVYGAPTTNPNQPPSPQPSVYLPAGKAYQVCKSLCESITDANWRNECRKLDGTLPEEIPGIGRIQLWSGSTIDEIFLRRNTNYQANIRAFMERHKDKHLDVIGCVECFVNGGAYTAIGCIETNPQLFIARVFSIAIPIMGGIILLGFLKIGFSTITSGGDPKKMEENKNLATSLIAGGLFVLGSTIIYSFIGGTVLGIPGFS